jgi:type IV secretory pathway VirB10-like protein
MNRRRRQPLKKRLKVRIRNPERQSVSAKNLIKKVALGAFVALGVAIAIGFGASHLFASRSSRARNFGNTQTVVAATPPPSPVEKETNPASANLETRQPEAVVSEDSGRSPLPTPVLTATPLSESTPIVTDNRTHEVKRSEVDRKSVERERRAAERKRSRLEAMYQKHEISSEAYKKGQDEYRSEMAKYRSALNGGEPTNE